MFDEKQKFFFGGGRSPGQILKELKNLLPILQISTGEFPDVDILPFLSLRSPRKRKGRGFLPAISPALHGDGSGA